MSQLTKDDIIAVLEVRLAEAIRSKEFSQEWYSTRWQRLKDFCEEKGFGKEVCDIFANGSLINEDRNVKDYWGQLNMMRHRAEESERALQKLNRESTRVRESHYAILYDDKQFFAALREAESALKWWNKENPS